MHTSKVALQAKGCKVIIRRHQTICTNCTTPLYYVLVPTCFGSSLPSSGSLLDPPELLEIQIGWVVSHMCVLCMYVQYYVFIVCSIIYCLYYVSIVGTMYYLLSLLDAGLLLT
jgi:hypothetical protein